MKIRITESQLERIKSRLTEGVADRYDKVVKLNFELRQYKGREVNWIEPVEARLNYIIEVEARSWGIKDISLYGIIGPERVEIEIDVYTDDEGNSELVTVPVVLDWSKVNLETEKGRGIVSIADEVEVIIGADNVGNLTAQRITLTTYAL